MNIVDLPRVIFLKLKRIPRSNIKERLIIGVKKYIQNYPSYISLQTVSACNLKCKHCFINDYRTNIHDGVIKIMKFDEFVLFVERLRPMIQKASYFQFSTFEAILNKNLFDMMDYILTINSRMKFPFLSNTMELSSDKIKKLEKYPVSEINISLDGCTKKTVEDFKTEVVFDKIIETIKQLKQSALKDKVAVTFVAHKNNVHELPQYVDFVNSLGVKQIYVSNILTFTKNLTGLELYSKEGNEYAEKIFAEAVLRAKRNQQNISMPRLKPELIGCQACETFFVDINGNVAPCDFLAVSTPFTLWDVTVQNKPVIFGNIFKDDPVSIFRSPAFKYFRNSHRLGKNLPKECTNCIDALGLMCSNRINYTA
ncbi:MAG: radical SAM protein [Flavisolibacter sp.]|nr:radical SAM protein [Flavisolibacter sp.]